MKLQRPLQSQSTQRIIQSVLPESFEISSNKNSNGYKFINLLYGAEVDNLRNKINEVYNNSFITSFDTTKDIDLYEVNISGSPIDNFLNISGIKIKITDEYEFFNGQPTRLIPISSVLLPMHYLTYSGSETVSGAGFQNTFSNYMAPCWSSLSGFIGLEYVRKDNRGSGYLIIASDINQENALLSGIYPVFITDVGTNFVDSGDYLNTYGLFTGIKNQNYSGQLKYETLQPIPQITLSSQYPLYRTIIDDSGIVNIIDHYTPYHGWTRNEFGTPVAIVDYSGTYYYDETGKKVYYRTAYNNPYGYNNYDIAYLDLEYTPISGTLKVYDMDILDISGNATEIPYSGKNLYYYKSSAMLLGNPSGQETYFDPIYIGYESIVPSGKGFSPYMEGSGASLYKTTSWDYLHESGKIDNGTLQYIDGSGNITNRIKLSGYYSRYIVEYKYKLYENTKYVTSLESNGNVSLATSSPVFTTNENETKEIDYEFTRDINYGDQASKIITFNGIDVRPESNVYKISFDIPIKYKSSNLVKNIHENINKKYIGYSNIFIPQVSNFRYYISNCYFDSLVSGNLIEIDKSNHGNDLTYSGNSPIFLINHDGYFGKKIIDSNSYFYKDNVSYLLENTYFWFNFSIPVKNTGTLMELYDYSLNKYIIIEINEDGRLIISSDGFKFYSREVLNFNSNKKELILKYTPDEFSSNIPIFKLYLRENSDWFRIIDITSSIVDSISVSSTTLKVYKNIPIDVGFFKIFYEAQ